MKAYRGKSVLHGIAIGKLYVIEKKESSWTKTTIADADREIARFQRAREEAQTELDELYQEALLQ